MFIFAFSFMVLGLVRHVALTVVQIVRTMRRAGDKHLNYKMLIIDTMKWLVPVTKVKEQILFSLTSLVFHVAVILAPVFLAGHIALWRRAVGLSWPALPNSVADLLTIIAVVTAIALVAERAAAHTSRALSRFQDYALPLVVALPFASGFLAMHPALNPFPFQATLLVHVLSGNLLFILIPLTKLSHMALIPGVQFVSEAAWHWPPDAGSRLAVTLGKENEKI
jgi:nitrate reductase gamma subunit